MKSKSPVYETFTRADVEMYAKAWGCSYTKAMKQLAKITCDQAC